jgi:ammonium transporter, Amt family
VRSERLSIGRQLGVQLLAVAAVAAWTAAATWALMKLADRACGARVSEEEESVGLDLSDHEERGYDVT